MTPEDQVITNQVANRFCATTLAMFYRGTLDLDRWRACGSVLTHVSGAQDARDALLMCQAQDERTHASAILIDVNPFCDRDIDAGGRQLGTGDPGDFTALYDLT